MKKAFLLCMLFLFLLGQVSVVAALETSEKQARDLTIAADLIFSDGRGVMPVKDRNRETYLSVASDVVLTVSSEEPISSVYIEFDRAPTNWFLQDESGNDAVSCGEERFLHQFVDVSALFGSPQTDLVLTFASSCAISDVFLYSDGALPDIVQRWEPARGACDLLLFATHSDDDQLFFAGLLPTYTARGLRVQVTYFVHHNPTHVRPHELLDGLWHTGVVRYPVISSFPDAYSESAEQAERNFNSSGFTHEEIVRWQTELLRAFRPLVVVGHDIQGEYGHGQHMYNTKTLMEAVSLSPVSTYDTESLYTTGVWDVPRCFLHLYEKNPITLDFDRPLEFFGGRTAFEVSKEAFSFHLSQQWTWFKDWVSVDRADEIRQYSPCEYGLFYSAEGETGIENDLFAGLMTYAEREAEEERRVQEALAAQKEQQAQLSEMQQETENLESQLSETQAEVFSTVVWMNVCGAVFGILLIVFVVTSACIFLRKRRNGEKR